MDESKTPTEEFDQIDMTTYWAVKSSGGSDEEAEKSARLVWKRENSKFFPKLMRNIKDAILSRAGLSVVFISALAGAWIKKELGL